MDDHLGEVVRTALAAGSFWAHVGDEQIGADELGERVAERVAALVATGVGPGDVVAAPVSGIESLVSLLGTWEVGAAAKLVADPFGDTMATAMVAEDDADEVVRRRGPGPANQPRGTAVVLTTSGTTGRPVAVSLGGDELVRSVIMTSAHQVPEWQSWPACRRGAPPGEVKAALAALRAVDLALPFMTVMPLTTVAGLTVLIRALVLCQGVIVYPTHDPARIADLVRPTGVASLALGPLAARRLARDAASNRVDTSAFSQVLGIGLGGGSVAAPVATTVADHLGAEVLIGYGSTELGGLAIASTMADDMATRATSLGRPLPGVDIEVRSDSGAPLPPGQRGTLWCRSPTTALGVALDGRAFLDTGDRAWVDDDERVHFAGRSTAQLLRAGRRIDPTPTEHSIESIPGVRSAALVGVSSRVAGETDLVAVVVSEPGAKVDRADLRRHLVAHSVRDPSVVVPQRVVAGPDVPLTADGAVRRLDALELARA